MNIFTSEEIKKYCDRSIEKIEGTSFLVYRDIHEVCNKNNVVLDKALDLGCGDGRSTKVIDSLSKETYATDISSEMIALASAKNKNVNFFLNKSNEKIYCHSSYTAIFSILMFFHFSSKVEMEKELRKCYFSLEKGGHLIVINGSKNIYVKNYSTIKGAGAHPIKDGDECHVYLKRCDLTVKDNYWSECFISQCAIDVGFKYKNLHYPIGKIEDMQCYIDEYNFPPYFYLVLEK